MFNLSSLLKFTVSVLFLYQHVSLRLAIEDLAAEDFFPFSFFFFFGFTDLGTTQWLNPYILKKDTCRNVGDMIGEVGGPAGPKAKDRLYKNFDQENLEN